jgi:hypothetical protein
VINIGTAKDIYFKKSKIFLYLNKMYNSLLNENQIIMKNKKFLLALPALFLFGTLFVSSSHQDRELEALINDTDTQTALTFPCAFCDAEVAACIAGGSFTPQECNDMMASCYAECQ